MSSLSNRPSATDYSSAQSSSHMATTSGASGASAAGYSQSSSAYDTAATTGQYDRTRANAATAATANTSSDNAMTRSEEVLRVGKETVEAGNAGLRKYITTEHESTTVPLRREIARVEREPITAENIDAALSGPELKESEYQVNLREERVRAEKETIPIERVRLTKEIEQGAQRVDADLRKEHIDIIDNTQTTAGEKTLGRAPDYGTTQQTSTRT